MKTEQPRGAGHHPGILLLTLCLLASAFARSAEGLYAFGGANARALEAYRQGWVEILSHGRWTEAERLYRLAVELDEDFLIAKSVLARITIDPQERVQLYREVEDRRDEIDADGRLIIDTYQRTLELFIARERGEVLPENFRGSLAADARRHYGQFLRRHPREWSVLIEYIEWVHAIEGAVGALEEIERLRMQDLYAGVSLSYFPASFYAESGDWFSATRAFQQFVAGLPAEQLPQPHFACALLAFEHGEYAPALMEVDRALVLDPRHLLAERLRRRILTQLADQSAATTSARSVQTIFSSDICIKP